MRSCLTLNAGTGGVFLPRCLSSRGTSGGGRSDKLFGEVPVGREPPCPHGLKGLKDFASRSLQSTQSTQRVHLEHGGLP